MLQIKDDDRFREARKTSLQNAWLKDLETVDFMRKQEKKSHKKMH